MIQVSNDWKTTMNDDTSYTAAATITLSNNTELTLTSEEFCVKTNKFLDGSSTGKFPVGEAMSRAIQIEIDNSAGTYSSYDFNGATIELSLVYGEESIDIGVFTATRPATYGKTVVIQAQDDMYKADKPFTSSLTYPSTAGALWAEICTTCGLTNGMSTVPQGTFAIATKPEGAITYRDALGYIAMLSGGNARINRDGEIEIINYNMTDLAAIRSGGGNVTVTDDGHGNITVTGDVTATASGGDVTILTGGVFTDDGHGNIVWTASGSWDVHDLNMWHSLKVDASDTTITGVKSNGVTSGSSGYVLTLDNPLWKGSEATALATVAAALCGVPFRCFEGEYIAYPLAEFGDLARITDWKGNTYYTIITNIEFTWSAPTFLRTSAETETETESTHTNNYVEKDSIDKVLKAVGINADWINAGSLKSEYIKLYGEMTVYTNDTLSEKAGSIGLGGVGYRIQDPLTLDLVSDSAIGMILQGIDGTNQKQAGLVVSRTSEKVLVLGQFSATAVNVIGALKIFDTDVSYIRIYNKSTATSPLATYRVGRTLTIRVYCDSNITASSSGWQTIGQIGGFMPTATSPFAPADDLYFTGMDFATAPPTPIPLKIGTDRYVSFYASAAGDYQPRGTITYVNPPST